MSLRLRPDTLAEGRRLLEAEAKAERHYKSQPVTSAAGDRAYDLWCNAATLLAEWRTDHFDTLLDAAAERDRLREALQEIAADHDPEPPEGPYNRAWCHCGNWSPTSCTAAIAQAALSEKEP